MPPFSTAGTMPTTVIAALSIVPIVLAAVLDYLYAGLRPSRAWVLRAHVGIAVVTVPLLIGVLVPGFERLTETSTGASLLTAGEIGLTYGILVLIWSLRTALEAASPSLFRR
jgi:hypothetical protein